VRRKLGRSGSSFNREILTSAAKNPPLILLHLRLRRG
jgi:hypothetical protein